MANILIRTVDEFEGMEPEEVASLIEGEVFISKVPVDQGETNYVIGPYKKQSEFITGMNTENKSQTEGELRFDVLFYVRMKDRITKMLIDIEAQKNEPTDYGILNRAKFYVSRIISSEKTRDFAKDNYDDMVKAYSIWICMNAKECVWSDMQTIQNDLLEPYVWKGDKDLTNIVLIGVPNKIPENEEKYELHRFLSALLSSKADVEERVRILKEEYNFTVDDNFEEVLKQMCNLSQGIREEGRQEGREETTLKYVLNMHKRGYPIEEIALNAMTTIEEVKNIIMGSMTTA